MTTTQRPRPRRPTDRLPKVNRAEVDAALDEGLRITLDGQSYELRIGDVTSTLTRELRARTGMSFQRLMACIVEDPDSDVIAAFVWMARRIRGDVVDFDDVEVSYRDLLADGFNIETAETEEVDTNPEA